MTNDERTRRSPREAAAEIKQRRTEVERGIKQRRTEIAAGIKQRRTEVERLRAELAEAREQQISAVDGTREGKS